MKGNEFGDRLNIVIRKSQCAQAFSRHLCADHIVMVEGGAFAFLEPTRTRLPNVVEQGSQPNNTEIKIAQRFVEFIVWPNVLDNCERMRQHILVPMNRVVL